MIFGKWDERTSSRHDSKGASPTPVSGGPVSGTTAPVSDPAKKTISAVGERAAD
jgi:hypothetical protein